MTSAELWVWGSLLLLGAYHGLNPAMGWLFAVALGMQQRSRRAVVLALLPIALGHGLAIGIVVALAALAQVVLPLQWVRYGVAAILFGLGLYRLFRSRHPTWGGMQVGFRDLTIWSFLMASAHGAGLMVLPILMRADTLPAASHHVHGPAANPVAVVVHTTGYLAVTAAIAVVVYEKLGLAMLKKAWINMDLIWAIALVISGCLTLLV